MHSDLTRIKTIFVCNRSMVKSHIPKQEYVPASVPDYQDGTEAMI